MLPSLTKSSRWLTLRGARSRLPHSFKSRAPGGRQSLKNLPGRFGQGRQRDRLDLILRLAEDCQQSDNTLKVPQRRLHVMDGILHGARYRSTLGWYIGYWLPHRRAFLLGRTHQCFHMPRSPVERTTALRPNFRRFRRLYSFLKAAILPRRSTDRPAVINAAALAQRSFVISKLVPPLLDGGAEDFGIRWVAVATL